MAYPPIPRPNPLAASRQAEDDMMGLGRGLAGGARQGFNALRGLAGAANQTVGSPLGQVGLALLTGPTKSSIAEGIQAAGRNATTMREGEARRQLQREGMAADEAYRQQTLGMRQQELAMRRQAMMREQEEAARAQQAENEAIGALAGQLAPLTGVNEETASRLLRTPTGSRFLLSRAQRPEADELSQNLQRIAEMEESGLVSPGQATMLRTGAINRAMTGSAAGVYGNVDLGQDQALRVDEDGNLAAQVIPGSVTDIEQRRERETYQREQAERQQREAQNRVNNEARAQVVLEDIGRAREVVTNSVIPATGPIGQVSGRLEGTPRAQLEALLDSVRANIAFGELQRMREASPTGGALGQVTERELQLLSAALGSLDASQGQEELLRTLDRVQQHYSRVVELLDYAARGREGGSQNMGPQSDQSGDGGAIDMRDLY